MPKVVHSQSPAERDRMLDEAGTHEHTDGDFGSRGSGVYELSTGLRLRSWPPMDGAVETRWVQCAFELVRFVAAYELEVERRWLKEKLMDLLESGEPVDEELLEAARVLFDVER